VGDGGARWVRKRTRNYHAGGLVAPESSVASPESSYALPLVETRIRAHSVDPLGNARSLVARTRFFLETQDAHNILGTNRPRRPLARIAPCRRSPGQARLILEIQTAIDHVRPLRRLGVAVCVVPVPPFIRRGPRVTFRRVLPLFLATECSQVVQPRPLPVTAVNRRPSPDTQPSKNQPRVPTRRVSAA
jgi:hypothetical protein